MYFLQTGSDNAGLLIFGAILGLMIYYVIIRGAVSSGTKRLLKEAEYQSRLLQEIAKKNGVEEEVLKAHFDKTFK